MPKLKWAALLEPGGVEELVVAPRFAGRSTAHTMGCDRCRAYVLYTLARCNWGRCTEAWCQGCGRYLFGAGPVGCPCDWFGNVAGERGHRTKAEQPRPDAPHRRLYGRRKGHR